MKQLLQLVFIVATGILMSACVEKIPVKADGSFKDCAACPLMVAIPKGQVNSSNLIEHEVAGQLPTYQITISHPFAVGVFEVSNAEWTAVMGKQADFFRGNEHPVEKVSWEDAARFVKNLSMRTGENYRLLDEQEWEYVARAGSSKKHWGDDVGQGRANCVQCGCQWCGQSSAQVGQFSPNAFGLYDVHGNVFEWVADCYDRNTPWLVKSIAKSKEPKACSKRVLRGGDWSTPRHYIHFSRRTGLFSSPRYIASGLRVARDLSPGEYQEYMTISAKKEVVLVKYKNPQHKEIISPSERNVRGLTDIAICRLATESGGIAWARGGFAKYVKEAGRRQFTLDKCAGRLRGAQ